MSSTARFAKEGIVPLNWLDSRFLFVRRLIDITLTRDEACPFAQYMGCGQKIGYNLDPWCYQKRKQKENYKSTSLVSRVIAEGIVPLNWLCCRYLFMPVRVGKSKPICSGISPDNSLPDRYLDQKVRKWIRINKVITKWLKNQSQKFERELFQTENCHSIFWYY